jgi:two-component system, NarL family, invasion response regulator UvrY
MIKVFIADDHAIVRKGLKQIVCDTEDMMVTGEADNGVDTLHMLRLSAPDALILDIAMPGKSGVEVLKQIKKEFPKLPVLILSMYPKEQYAVRLIKAGAAGYLTKESAPELLVKAIRTVAQGKRFIGPGVAELLANELERDPDLPPHHDLSDREFQTLRLIASGKSVSEIADTLALSVKTISTYRTRILVKMDLKNNAEIMHYALKNNLID